MVGEEKNLSPCIQPYHLAPWGGGEGSLADQGLRRKKLREGRVGAGAHLESGHTSGYSGSYRC